MKNLILDMVESVKSNLQKNGFPGKSVAFSIDQLYDAAHNKGFHFNKVREALELQGVKSVLEGSKIVFSATEEPQDMDLPGMEQILKDPKYSDMLKDPNFLTQAMTMFSQMDSSQLAKFAGMVPGLDLEKLQTVKEKFKNMNSKDLDKLKDLSSQLGNRFKK